jgi:hypothetical protein
VTQATYTSRVAQGRPVRAGSAEAPGRVQWVRRFTPKGAAALLTLVPLARALHPMHLDALTEPGTGPQPTNPTTDPVQPASDNGGDNGGYSQGVNWPIQNGDQGTSPPILGGTNGITDPGYSQGVNYPIQNGDQGGSAATPTVRQAQLMLSGWAKLHPADVIPKDYGQQLTDLDGSIGARFSMGLASYQRWQNAQPMRSALRTDGQLDQQTYDMLTIDCLPGSKLQPKPGTDSSAGTAAGIGVGTVAVVGLGALALWKLGVFR